MADITERLIAAMNRHDAGAVAAFFAADYRSEQPLHPNRGFGGSEQVLENWTSVFEGVPDFVAERSLRSPQRAWSGRRCAGRAHIVDGAPFLMRGVTVLGVHDDKITWARLYMEPVERVAPTSGARFESSTVHPRMRMVPRDDDSPEAAVSPGVRQQSLDLLAPPGARATCR